MDYAAFISYSHADEATARWLHKKLESYRTPRTLVGHAGRHGPVRKRVGKIFRDRDEFAAGGDLRSEIQDALRRSDALIVLCSPKAAASGYVSAEIELFKSLGRAGRIIPVILEGEPRDCYPKPLQGDDLLGADFRDGRDGRDAGRLRVLAGLYGVGFDELVQRERIAERRRLRAAIGAVALFAGLAVTAAALGVVARRNGAAAEQRAALMSIDSARSQLNEGEVDQALLVLLDAARVLGAAPPDALLIEFQEALSRATTEKLVAVGKQARFFSSARSVYTVDGDSTEISQIQDDGSLKQVAQAGKAVGAVLPDGHGGLVVVRNDLAVEHHPKGRPRQVVGSFARRGAAWDATGFEIRLVDTDLLLWQPLFDVSGESANDQPAQLFDLRARRAITVPVPRSMHVGYARLPDRRRVVFDPTGFVANIDAPPDAGAVARWMDAEQTTTPGYPPFETLAEISCYAGLPSPSAEQRKGFREALDRSSASGSLTFACHAVGSNVVIRVEQATSAGIDRSDLFVDRDGAVRAITVPVTSGSPPSPSWADVSELDQDEIDDDVLQLVVGRRILVQRVLENEIVLDRNVAYSIKFASQIGPGKIVVAEEGRDVARILDFAPAQPFGVRTMGGEIDEKPEPALHPSACGDRPYTGEMDGYGRLTVEADPTAKDDYGPLTFRVRVESQPPFEKAFTSPGDQRCVAIAAGGRYIAVGSAEDRMEIHDLAEAMRAQPSKIGELEATAWGDPGMNAGSTMFFVGTGPTLISTSGGKPVLQWIYDVSTKRWTSSEIYRGDLPVRSAEPDSTGRRLLLREDLDHSDVAARIYSLDARRTWRELGRDYKWLFAMFNARGEAVVAKHWEWQSAVSMVTLDEAMTSARDQLSPRCRDFTGDNFRDSSCWPTALGR